MILENLLREGKIKIYRELLEIYAECLILVEIKLKGTKLKNRPALEFLIS